MSKVPTGLLSSMAELRLQHELHQFLPEAQENWSHLRVKAAWSQVVCSTWKILQNHAWKLRDSCPVASQDLSDITVPLQAVLRRRLQFIDNRVSSLQAENSVEDYDCTAAKLGLGSPSTTGCLDAQGKTVKLNVLQVTPPPFKQHLNIWVCMQLVFQGCVYLVIFHCHHGVDSA